jgi:hypothetical protein
MLFLGLNMDIGGIMAKGFGDNSIDEAAGGWQVFGAYQFINI